MDEAAGDLDLRGDNCLFLLSGETDLLYDAEPLLSWETDLLLDAGAEGDLDLHGENLLLLSGDTDILYDGEPFLSRDTGLLREFLSCTGDLLLHELLGDLLLLVAGEKNLLD